MLLNALAACGAPGSDAVFTKENPKAAFPGSANPGTAPPIRRFETRPHGGYFRRVGDQSQFQPCGTSAPLDIFGSPQAQSMLKERFRWNTVWEGARMFGFLQGAIVTDTPKTTAGDSIHPGPRTRFFLVSVDSLRTWRTGDCGGMRIP